MSKIIMKLITKIKIEISSFRFQTFTSIWIQQGCHNEIKRFQLKLSNDTPEEMQLSKRKGKN